MLYKRLPVGWREEEGEVSRAEAEIPMLDQERNAPVFGPIFPVRDGGGSVKMGAAWDRRIGAGIALGDSSLDDHSLTGSDDDK